MNNRAADATITMYASHFAGRSRAITRDGSTVAAFGVRIGDDTSSKKLEGVFVSQVPTAVRIGFGGDYTFSSGESVALIEALFALDGKKFHARFSQVVVK